MAAIGELVKAASKTFTINRAAGDISFSGVNGQIDMTSLLTASGLKVDEAGALRIAAAWIAVTLIADEVGTLNLKLIRRDDRERREVQPAGLAPLWDDDPNRDQGTVEWQIQNALSLSLYGVVYGQLGWLRSGGLSETFPIDPAKASLERAEDGGIRLKVAGQGELWNRAPVGGVRQRPEFLFIPRWRLPGQLQPVSPVAYAAELLGLSKAYEQTAAKLMGKGLAPSAVLTFDEPLEPEESEKQSRRLTQLHGNGKSGGVVVIGGKGAKLQPWTMSLNDAQWLGVKVFDLCMALWRVPPTVVGMVGKPSTWGTGIAEFSRGLERFTLRPMVQLLTAGYRRYITRWVDPSLQVKMPFESMLSASPKDRAEVQRSELMMGATSLERILEKNDQPPFRDDETRFTQLSLATEEDRRLKRIAAAAEAAAKLMAANVGQAEAFRVTGLDQALAAPNLG